MLNELINIQNNVLSTVDKKLYRYLYDQINWDNKVICVFGARGTGKTTMLMQHYFKKYNSPEKCLYISADNINVLNAGIYTISQEFFKYGGEAIIIDEIHKYPNWSQELKNIIDTYKNKNIIISGSSAIELKKSKYDLSRRAVYYELKGLSFREFLEFEYNIKVNPVTLEDLIKNHVEISSSIAKDISILKHFKEYLEYGYYPFYLEGKNEYYHRLYNVIEKVMYEDLTVVYQIKVNNIILLKKILWLVASSELFTINITKLSSELGIAKETVYNYLEYLEHSGLIANVYTDNIGYKLIRKPNKIYMENTNLLYSISGKAGFEIHKGTVRETFFVNQLKEIYDIKVSVEGDFLVDNKYVVEIGGKNKNMKQIFNIDNAFLAVDEIEIGFKTKIPLYTFGLLY